MELVAPVEERVGRHGRSDVARAGGAGQTRLHSQLVIVQVLHPVKVLRLFLE